MCAQCELRVCQISPTHYTHCISHTWMSCFSVGGVKSAKNASVCVQAAHKHVAQLDAGLLLPPHMIGKKTGIEAKAICKCTWHAQCALCIVPRNHEYENTCG